MQFICPFCQHQQYALDFLQGQEIPCVSCGGIVECPEPFPDPLPEAVVIRRQKPNEPGNTWRSVAVPSVAGLALLVVLIGAFLVATKSNGASKKKKIGASSIAFKPSKHEDHEDDPEPKRDFARESRDREEARKADANERWLEEVNEELAAALAAREKRVRDTQVRLGSLTESESRRATSALRLVNKYGTVHRLPREAVELARKIDPWRIEWLEHDLLIKKGKSPELAARRELFLSFQMSLGKDQVHWHLFFDLGNDKEISRLNDAIQKRLPFRQLSKSQRLLLLDMGAVDYFAAQIRGQ